MKAKGIAVNEFIFECGGLSFQWNKKKINKLGMMSQLNYIINQCKNITDKYSVYIKFMLKFIIFKFVTLLDIDK